MSLRKINKFFNIIKEITPVAANYAATGVRFYSAIKKAITWFKINVFIANPELKNYFKILCFSEKTDKYGGGKH